MKKMYVNNSVTQLQYILGFCYFVTANFIHLSKPNYRESLCTEQHNDDQCDLEYIVFESIDRILQFGV